MVRIRVRSTVRRLMIVVALEGLVLGACVWLDTTTRLPGNFSFNHDDHCATARPRDR